MSGMIDRVAKVLFEDRYITRWHEPVLEVVRDAYRRRAIAVIAAMREPTEAMIEAHQEECAGTADEAGPLQIVKAWQAMIDEAMK